MIYKIDLNTVNGVEYTEISQEVQKIVSLAGVQSGVCHIFVPHTTAAVTINEHADPDVKDDMIKQLAKIVPLNSDYRHSEGNSAAHLKASLIGNNVMLFVENGKLVLGTWQGIFFCEFDGPRSSEVIIKVLSD